MLYDGVGVPLVLDRQVMHASPQINIFLEIVQTGGDSSDKPTAMQSRSMARSQCWPTDSLRAQDLHPFVQFAKNNNLWRLVHHLMIRHQRHTHSIIQHRWRLSTLIANSVEKTGISHPPHCITHRLLWWRRLDVLAFWAPNQVAYWVSVSSGTWGSHSKPFLRVDCCRFVYIWCTKQSGPFWICCPTLPSDHWQWLHHRWFVVWVSTHLYSLQKILICGDSCIAWRSDTSGMPTPSYSIGDVGT